MVKAPNHKCLICGEEYYCCNDCSNMRDFTPWRRTACSIECFQTYLTFVDYEAGKLTKEQFKDALLGNEMDKKHIATDFKKVVDDVLAYQPPAVFEPEPRKRSALKRNKPLSK